MGNRFGKKRKKNPMEPPPVASRPSNTEQPLEQELATAEEDLNESFYFSKFTDLLYFVCV